MDAQLETAPGSFVSFDDNGVILSTNLRLRTILGYGERELEGKSLETILSIGGRIFYHTHFFPLLKMQGLVEEVYLSLQSKGGEEIPMLVNAARRGSVNDCMMMRMRQRHRYEDELVRARKAAELANDAKAKFLSMMSHDLRTPLQAISGYAELLMLSGDLNAEQRENVDAIKSAGREMLRLINDILGFAQLDSGKVEVRIEPVPIEDVLARAELLMRVRFDEKRIRFSRAECADISVAADADRLQQALLNLLTNALKFTPEGGSIEVRCRPDGEKVHIDVRDTGIGIAPEDLTRIFEPFVQVDSQHPASQHGVGLGLSISRELVRAMHGDLTVTSEVGRGSTFTVTLARAES
jgi:PAS domain S-box-containing protein